MFAWDLDNDGEFDDATGANPTIAWSTLDTLELIREEPNPIALHVTVNGLTDIDATTLTIEPEGEGGDEDPAEPAPDEKPAAKEAPPAPEPADDAA